jgi:kumamolisin
MASTNRIQLPGSVRNPLDGAVISGTVKRDEVINVTVYADCNLRRKDLPDPTAFSLPLPSKRTYLSPGQVGELLMADPNDLAEITAFLEGNGLSVAAQPGCRRSLSATGPIGKFEEAFGTKLSIWQHPTGAYRGRSGPLTVPPNVHPLIRGAFGLDNRRVGVSYVRRGHKPRAGNSIASPTSFLATQLATLYSFPPSANGAGQTVAILAFNGAIGTTGQTATGGFSEQVLSDYFTGTLGIALPTISTVVVQGPGNTPDPTNQDDVSDEVMLDITMVGATAPGASIVVYFSEFTEQGWVNAFNRIVTDQTPTIATCSYGNPETSLASDSQSIWSNAAITEINDTFQVSALKGLSIFCAAGDSGSTDGESGSTAHVDFPASSPFVTACGGTSLKASGSKISSESVWNDGPGSATGGGVSALFPLPTFQAKSKVPVSVNSGHVIGRGVPDVAADADPDTGVQVPLVSGSPETIGGTSAVAPLWAGLFARINQANGKPSGYLNPFLYQNCATGVLNDITAGNNGQYSAGPGWDACTGIGTPNGVKLLTAFKG